MEGTLSLKHVDNKFFFLKEGLIIEIHPKLWGTCTLHPKPLKLVITIPSETNIVNSIATVCLDVIFLQSQALHMTIDWTNEKNVLPQ